MLFHFAVEGYSIYIRNLPHNATPSQLEAEFKKFGSIKPGGVQVRNHKVVSKHSMHIFSPSIESINLLPSFCSNMAIALVLLNLN